MASGKLCECGCGEVAKKGNRFIHGHNSKSNHPMQGKKHSEEFSKKSRLSHLGKPSGAKGLKHSEESRKKMSESHKGIPLSEKHCESIGKTSIRTWASKTKEERAEWGRRIGIGQLGKVISEEAKKKCSEANKGKRFSPRTEFKKGICPWQKGKSPTNESIDKNRESNKKRVTPEMRKQTSERMKGLWANPEHAKKCLSFNSPNKQELKLAGILESMYPGEWKFVGDGQVIIAGKFPDFININGQKKIIELYGEFFHKDDDPEDRAKVFRPYGYDTLVIWGKELSGQRKLKAKLQEFCEGAKK